MAVPRIHAAARALATLTALVAVSTLPGCGTTQEGKPLIPLPWLHKPAPKHAEAPTLPSGESSLGGYAKGDEQRPAGAQPDATVKTEPLVKWANRPYSVLGQSYTPILHDKPFVQRGKASWYGARFHGQKTASGELYDMHKLTAAHPTLPIPSYAKVTSLDSGKSVVVRINDRGPFHGNRIIDVSYAAAVKLELMGKGSHMVEVERLFADDPTRIATVRRAAASLAQSAPEIEALMLEDRVETDSAAIAQVPGKAAGQQYYIQLGSYGRAESAEAMSRKLKDAGVELGSLEVVQAGSANRLYGGPFATRAQANKAVRGLPKALKLKPIVVRR